jgi:hypothetical protein
MTMGLTADRKFDWIAALAVAAGAAVMVPALVAAAVSMTAVAIGLL